MKNFEELKYTIEDNTIIELLGVQNFTNQNSAILELVKNAYDAKANSLTIEFTDDCKLIISDDGEGMDEEDIKVHWMRIGGSTKQYSVTDTKGNQRVQAGQKGIGRLAMARLGSDAEVFSQKADCLFCSYWITDWKTTKFSNNSPISHIGTRIIISGLRDSWSEKKIDDLKVYLSKAYNDSSMKISVKFKNEEDEVAPYFKDIKKISCASSISFDYKSSEQLLLIKINNDEFSDEARQYVLGTDLFCYEPNPINVSDTLCREFSHLSGEEFKKITKDIGDFSGNFLFRLTSVNSEDQERFLYKHRYSLDRNDTGIVLYRNAFTISSYEGGGDWLNLNQRARKSPAMATHPTGSWRMRSNHISGQIHIDREKNKVLKELSNRQGFNEDIYYQVFVEIITLVFSEFERYRQNIIRQINKKNKPEPRAFNLKKSFKSKEVIDALDQAIGKEGREQLIQEYETLKSERSLSEERTQHLKYDVELLQAFATVGLKSTSLAHELDNDKSNISSAWHYLREALIQYGVWDMLNSPDRTKFSHSSVPRLIKTGEEINIKIVALIDALLSKIEKKSFKRESIHLLQAVTKIIEQWKKNYSWVQFNLDIDSDLVIITTENSLSVIFDNLILNSIQQNDEKNDNNSLIIDIQILLKDNKIISLYKDNGKGLAKKYLVNPKLILEVHETTRENGHGIGMWMLNNIVQSMSGEVEEIKGDIGFTIRFTMGEVL